MKIGRYGVEIGHAQVIFACEDKHGTYLIVKGRRQEVDVRITPSGLVRVGTPRKTHPGVTCFGPKPTA